jgi:hypothetical protein
MTLRQRGYEVLELRTAGMRSECSPTPRRCSQELSLPIRRWLSAKAMFRVMALTVKIGVALGGSPGIN